MQSTGKDFAKTVMNILQSVKAREEGKTLKPHVNPTPRPGAPPIMQSSSNQPKQLPNYNRYDQEQFHGKDHTHGFNIETTGTFSGNKISKFWRENSKFFLNVQTGQSAFSAKI